jgi:hypothetical protein
MSAKKSPLAQQKEVHGGKEKLVDRLVTMLAQITKSDESKDDLKGRLLAASNKKLLRLFEVAGEIKDKYGSVEKLAEQTAAALGRAKDAPYLGTLKAMSPARLLDLLRTAEKRGKKKSERAA